MPAFRSLNNEGVLAAKLDKGEREGLETLEIGTFFSEMLPLIVICSVKLISDTL